MKCPSCGHEMTSQYDTVSEENYWQCENDRCGNTYAIDGVSPTYPGTAVEEDPEDDE